MALGRLLRRLLFGGVIIAAGGVAAVHPELIRGYYLDVYPTDPAKRQALELCFLQDHKFNRLDSDEREACYRRALMPTEAASREPAPDLPVANPIDLRRAAGAGSLPRNDVRRTEQTKNALHLPQ